MKFETVMKKAKVVQDQWENWIFVVFFGLLWVKDTLLSYVRGFIDGVPFLRVVYDALYFLVAVVCAILLLRRVLSRCTKKIWIFVGSLLLCYAATICISPAANRASEQFGMFFFQVLPLFFVGLAMPSEEKERARFFQFLYYLSIMSIVASFLYMFYFRLTGRSFSGPNNMDMAYKNIIPVLFVTWYAGKKRDWVGYVAVALGVFFMMAMGTRGVQLMMGLWIIICFVCIGSNRKLKLMIVGGLALLVILLFATGLIIPIAQWMKNIFDSMGINSRVFEFILDSSLLDDNGRAELWGPAVEALSLIPGGLMYDRHVLQVGYVHNLALELMLDFGIVGGIALLVALVLLATKAAVRAEGMDRWFLLQFCCLFAVKLMLSSSYLQEPYFFFMLGFAVYCLKEYPQRRVQLLHGKSFLV